jgi:hypothetical protein
MTAALDLGTPQLQAHRQRLVGPNADPALASHTLGVMLARGIIEQEQYYAAIQFAELQRRATGIEAVILTQAWERKGKGNEVWWGIGAGDADLQRRHRETVAALDAYSYAAVNELIVDATAVPRWFGGILSGALVLPDKPGERRKVLERIAGWVSLNNGLNALIRIGRESRRQRPQPKPVTLPASVVNVLPTKPEKGERLSRADIQKRARIRDALQIELFQIGIGQRHLRKLVELGVYRPGDPWERAEHEISNWLARQIDEMHESVCGNVNGNTRGGRILRGRIGIKPTTREYLVATGYLLPAAVDDEREAFHAAERALAELVNAEYWRASGKSPL